MRSLNEKISVIIPALNEEDRIDSHLRLLCGRPGVEIIVADGGSLDGTAEAAAGCGARVVRADLGRAKQMNTARREAHGDILLFLHADTKLPQDFEKQVQDVLNRPGTSAGAFLLRIDSPGFGLRLIEYVANLRSKWLQAPYGDQAIFVSARVFDEIGGYPEMPIMEDFELIRRLRRKGRIAIAPGRARTSSRRWRNLGLVRTTITNWSIVVGYWLGVSPARLERWYRS